MNKTIIIALITSILISCSNNEEQKRIHFEKVEVGKSLKIDYLNNHLANVKADLVKAELELKKINQFQLGRSSSTKRKQLLAQQDIINGLQASIERIGREISLSGLFESFEFQETPEGTIQHIFYAAKTADYEKLRHLSDPYGECNETVLKLCLVEIQDNQSKENWNGLFSFGRIMNKLRQTDNEADFEIAIGENSSQLVTIRLIKRLDKWYLIEA